MSRRQHTVAFHEPEGFREPDSLVMRRVKQMQRLQIIETKRLNTYVAETLQKKKHVEGALETATNLLEKFPLSQLPAAISREVLLRTVRDGRTALLMSRHYPHSVASAQYNKT